MVASSKSPVAVMLCLAVWQLGDSNIAAAVELPGARPRQRPPNHSHAYVGRSLHHAALFVMLQATWDVILCVKRAGAEPLSGWVGGILAMHDCGYAGC
jgi:hypothetical protein